MISQFLYLNIKYQYGIQYKENLNTVHVTVEKLKCSTSGKKKRP